MYRGGQQRRRVPGEFSQCPQVDPRSAPQRQVGVAEGVEVGVLRPVRAIVDVRDADGFEVRQEHGRGLINPFPNPDVRVGGLPGEVAADRIGHVGRQRLHLRLAGFIELGGE